ncbi:MAG: hypothetical protein MUO62_18940 [Anaerolineales bacterium]|nr:hypothetical protein [Anaerolineales bacterium]
MAVYKVSYVVTGSDHPGGIVNLDYRPVERDILKVGDNILEVLEVVDLMPPRGNFYYIHATCKIAESK